MGDYPVKAVAYQIKRESNNEVLFEGIVRHAEDNIYPAQDEPYYTDEFPSLPFECELWKFKVPGLKLEYFTFSMTVNELRNWKV